MTEAEAKTKWCPYARTYSNGFMGNRDETLNGIITSIEEGSLCRGSACMAWRADKATGLWRVTWKEKTETWCWNPTGVKGYEGAVVEVVLPGGFCGLAGKP